MINPEKLSKELAAAGIEFSGCNENGIVWDIDGKTEIQEKKKVKEIIAKHDPNSTEKILSTEERLKRLEEKIGL